MCVWPRTKERQKDSVRRLIDGALQVGEVIVWYDWAQSLTLPLGQARRELIKKQSKAKRQKVDAEYMQVMKAQATLTVDDIVRRVGAGPLENTQGAC